MENSKLSDILSILINKGLYVQGAPLYDFPKIECMKVIYQITCKLPKTKLFREKDKIIYFCIQVCEWVNPSEQAEAFLTTNSIVQQIANRYFENNEYGTIFTTILRIFDELEWKNDSQCFSMLLNLLDTPEKMAHLREQVFLGLLDKILVYISGRMSNAADDTISMSIKRQNSGLPTTTNIMTKKNVRLLVLKFLYQMIKRSTSEFVSFLYLDVRLSGKKNPLI